MTHSLPSATQYQYAQSQSSVQTLLDRNQPSARLDAESVRLRLEEAGATLLALPDGGPSTRLAQSGMQWVRDAAQH